MDSCLISVIIPCYCSEQFLEHSVSLVKKEFLRQEGYSCQIILVNDGSTDGTSDVIRRICGKDSSIWGIDLAGNYGQAQARLAGLCFADGEISIFMDDDGQHPAEGIFPLVRKIREGYDLVYAQFPFQKEALWRRMGSRFTDQTMNLRGIKPKDIRITSFFAISRLAMQMLREYHSSSPFIGGFLMSQGVRVAGVPTEHRERKTGKSGYTLKKLIRAWFSQQKKGGFSKDRAHDPDRNPDPDIRAVYHREG